MMRPRDQETAIVGAEVERRVDAGSRRLRADGRFSGERRRHRPQLTVRRKAVAEPRVVIHTNCLSAAG